jgi:hypothetical protein
MKLSLRSCGNGACHSRRRRVQSRASATCSPARRPLRHVCAPPWRGGPGFRAPGRLASGVSPRAGRTGHAVLSRNRTLFSFAAFTRSHSKCYWNSGIVSRQRALALPSQYCHSFSSASTAANSASASSRSSIISAARTAGLGRFSVSARESSLSQKRSKLALSRAIRSA